MNVPMRAESMALTVLRCVTSLRGDPLGVDPPSQTSNRVRSSRGGYLTSGTRPQRAYSSDWGTPRSLSPKALTGPPEAALDYTKEHDQICCSVIWTCMISMSCESVHHGLRFVFPFRARLSILQERSRRYSLEIIIYLVLKKFGTAVSEHVSAMVACTNMKTTRSWNVLRRLLGP